MARIQHHECVIEGRWVVSAGRVIVDSTCDRIHFLVTDYLCHLADTDDGWSRLYSDPADGRLWELSYPQSHLHGGGPPTLTAISSEQAAIRFGL